MTSIARLLADLQESLTVSLVHAPDEYGDLLDTTWEQESSSIRQAIEEGIRRTRREHVRAWLRAALTDLEAATEAFDEGDVHRGRRALDSASWNVERARSRKKAKATFVAGPTGVERVEEPD